MGPKIGVFCIGLVVMYFTMYIVRRMEKFTPKALSALVTVILGGGTTGFIEKVAKDVWWWYPIGLVAMLVLYSLGLWASKKGLPLAQDLLRFVGLG